MRSIFYVFVPVFFAFATLCSATTSGEPCCGGRGYNDSSETITGQSDVLQNLEQKAVCKCEGGYCAKENGKEVCKCYEGWGLVPGASIFQTEYCKKCDCRANYNCTYSNSLFGGVSKKCLCPDGYEDKSGNCKGTCKKNPCRNGGKCLVTGDETGDDIKCRCIAPYTGKLCEKKGNDPCSSKPCKNGGTCTVVSGNAKCNCTERYSGDNCETDKCSLLNCKNGGKCIIKDGKPTCSCTDKYTGTNCEIDKCSALDCKNGGKCGIKDVKAFCNCTDRYIGVNCEKVDLCKDICGVRYYEQHEEISCVELDFGGVMCLCRDPFKLFDRVEKECKVDKCWERCGVGFGDKQGDVLCVGDRFDYVRCFCKDEKRVFNPEQKKCQGESKILHQFIWILCSIIILLASIIGCFTLSRCRKNFGRRQSNNC